MRPKACTRIRQEYMELTTALLYGEVVNAWSAWLSDEAGRQRLSKETYGDHPWRAYVAPEAEKALDLLVILTGKVAVGDFLEQALNDAKQNNKGKQT